MLISNDGGVKYVTVRYSFLYQNSVQCLTPSIFSFPQTSYLRSAMQKKTLGTTPRLGSAGGLLTHTIMGEVQDSNNTITDKQSILLQKQRQLQTMHSNQHQKLLHKQKKEYSKKVSKLYLKFFFNFWRKGKGVIPQIAFKS